MGGVCSLCFMSWMYLRAKTIVISGDVYFPGKEVSTEGCHYHFTPKESPYMVLHLDANSTNRHITHTE